MPDDKPPNDTCIADTSSGFAVGLALGVAFGMSVDNLATGIGTGVAVGVACGMMRRKGSKRWVLWLGAYAVLVLIAFALKLTGVIK